MGTGLLNHHVKKGSMMVVMMDLDQNLFPSTVSYGASFCSINIIMSFNMDVVVMVNDYHHLLGGGTGHSSKSSMIVM